jgi:hypothetical protein
MKPLDPRIGVLNSGQYYAFAHGYDKPAKYGTLDEVEVALGLRQPAPASAIGSRHKKTWLKRYAVTVTPKYVTCAGSCRFGQYTVEVHARTSAEAITEVRRARNLEEGRYGVPATYKAKRQELN